MTGAARHCRARAALLAAVWVLGGAATAASAAGPAWAQLAPAERRILAPLEAEWEKLDAQRKEKWRGIAERYPRMSPAEQQRVQEQMRPWATLSPQERAAAREQYKTLNQLPPEKKQDVKQKWERYQSLPPEERQKLGARPPPPASNPAPAGAGAAPAGTAPPHGSPGSAPASPVPTVNR